MTKCAFLSMDDYGIMNVHDHLVGPHLKELGWEMEEVSWHQININWSDYEQVVIRSTWDYHYDLDAFLRVLETIEASSAKLENSLDMVKWNIDKIYLKELETQGLAVIPTLWHDRLVPADNSSKATTLTREDMEGFCDHWKTDQIVLKPRISASAANTFWFPSKAIAGQEDSLEKVKKAFAHKDFMVQPFVAAIQEEGEYSVFYFNGQLSHVIRKRPMKGDFRVQAYWGGHLELVDDVPDDVRVCAEASMDAIQKRHGEMPLYARLDLVRFGGEFVLMEVELIEPSMYFNLDEGSPKRFARAMLERAAGSCKQT